MLNTDSSGAQSLVLTGEPVKYYDNIHDLFVDIF